MDDVRGKYSTGEALTDLGPGREHRMRAVAGTWNRLRVPEEVYLHAYDSAAAKAGIGNYLAFYNGQRPHTALARNTPAANSLQMIERRQLQQALSASAGIDAFTLGNG